MFVSSHIFNTETLTRRQRLLSCRKIMHGLEYHCIEISFNFYDIRWTNICENFSDRDSSRNPWHNQQILDNIYNVLGISCQIDQAETPTFFMQVCYRWPQNKTRISFQILLKNSLAVMIEIVDLALRAVINSFEICPVILWLKKNRD